MSPDYSIRTLKFLEGDGEMAGLIRSKDWSKTAIGDPEKWPQSLRTTLSIVLNSKFPMFLWWGAEMIQFYNDAYRPSLGNEGKHPKALGQRAEDCWGEIWHIIKPLIDQVGIPDKLHGVKINSYPYSETDLSRMFTGHLVIARCEMKKMKLKLSL